MQEDEQGWIHPPFMRQPILGKSPLESIQMMKGNGFPLEKIQEVLGEFLRENEYERLPDDLP